MLLRLQAGFERSTFAELEESPQLKSEFGQRGEQLIFRVVIRLHIYIVARYIFK
jgi:hypothetical protein